MFSVIKILSCFIFLVFLSVQSFAQDNEYVAPDVNIISITPVQGSGLDIERVPGKIQTISRDQLSKKKKFFYYRNPK